MYKAAKGRRVDAKKGTGRGQKPSDRWEKVTLKDQSQVNLSDMPEGQGFEEVAQDIHPTENFVIEGRYRRARTQDLQEQGVKTAPHGAGHPSMQRDPQHIPPDTRSWAPPSAPPAHVGKTPKAPKIPHHYPPQPAGPPPQPAGPSPPYKAAPPVLLEKQQQQPGPTPMDTTPAPPRAPASSHNKATIPPAAPRNPKDLTQPKPSPQGREKTPLNPEWAKAVDRTLDEPGTPAVRESQPIGQLPRQKPIGAKARPASARVEPKAKASSSSEGETRSMASQYTAPSTTLTGHTAGAASSSDNTLQVLIKQKELEILQLQLQQQTAGQTPLPPDNAQDDLDVDLVEEEHELDQEEEDLEEVEVEDPMDDPMMADGEDLATAPGTGPGAPMRLINIIIQLFC